MSKLKILNLCGCLVIGFSLFSQISTTGYNHVGLSVKEIDASAKFYREVVGLQPIEVPDNLKAIRAWFKVAPGQELHLLAGRTDPVTNNDKNGAHFSLTIQDADPIEAYLKKTGLAYHRQQRFDGAYQIYITDPDGYVIELNEPKVQWRQLFNGKDLEGWDTYLGPQFPPVGDDRTGVAPIGLNIDPKKTFTVAEIDGAPAISISGEHFGGISTKEEFENYHLRLDFKWGKNKFHPRENYKKDSGLLYHAVGEHGADYGFWMQSQEFQIQQGDCGDFWGVAGAVIDIPATKQGEKDWIYDPKGDLKTFMDKTETGRHCIRSTDFEKPDGEWNTLDLYCFGDTAVHVVNGQVVMVLYNSRRPINGAYEPLTKGKIQLQSEGAAIYYRNIWITPIAKLPESFIKS